MTWTLLAALAAPALAGECEAIDLADIVSIPPPAVVVLGERRGTQPDLYRASRVVWHLRHNAPVRVALEAVGPDQQATLDAYADREIEPEDLEEALDWHAGWGWPYGPYARLLAHARHGVEVIAIRQPTGDNAPRRGEAPVPAGYVDVLRDVMSGHEVPLDVEMDFVQYVAWRDLRLAEAALAGWDRRGYLVVVVDRAQVEGGKGVQWQAAEMVDVPVHAFTLSWAGTPCYAGDRVWKAGLAER